MLTIEEYARVYLPMVSAVGNAEQEAAICKENNITIAQWNEAQSYYMAKMTDPSDFGKTALAFSEALKKLTEPVKKSNVPSDFTATQVSISISEFDVQMVNFSNKDTGQHILLQLGFEAKDDFEINYIKGRVHISINDQSYSIYGGVSKVELSSTQVTFIFDAEGRERMQCDRITVSYQINGKLYNLLKRKMRFLYKTLLEIKAEPTPEVYHVNDLQLHDSWAAFTIDALDVEIRPRLKNMQETGKYPQVVFVDFMSGTIGQDDQELRLLDEVKSCLLDILEKDLAAVMAFYSTDDHKRRFFIYTYLDQGKFMERINEAFRLLPRLPLEFSGGADEKWENYSNCLADYERLKL